MRAGILVLWRSSRVGPYVRGLLWLACCHAGLASWAAAAPALTPVAEPPIVDPDLDLGLRLFWADELLAAGEAAPHCQAATAPVAPRRNTVSRPAKKSRRDRRVAPCAATADVAGGECLISDRESRPADAANTSATIAMPPAPQGSCGEAAISDACAADDAGTGCLSDYSLARGGCRHCLGGRLRGGCLSCLGRRGPYMDRGFNCTCDGSYKFPVPPLYTYHWPGMYSQQLMTDYHSPWRFLPLVPYQDESPLGVPPRLADAPARPAAAATANELAPVPAPAPTAPRVVPSPAPLPIAQVPKIVRRAAPVAPAVRVAAVAPRNRRAANATLPCEPTPRISVAQKLESLYGSR